MQLNMPDNQNKFKNSLEVNKIIDEISNNFFIRSRTNYQLKHFVVNQHDTPQMQYYQILLESWTILNSIEKSKIDIEILKEKIKKLESSSDKIDILKSKKKRIELESMEYLLASTMKELEYLAYLFSQYPKYTYEDIEANQPEYWEKRLSRQANLDINAREYGISVGNLDSMLQSGMAKIDEFLNTSNSNKELEYSKENTNYEIH